MSGKRDIHTCKDKIEVNNFRNCETVSDPQKLFIWFLSALRGLSLQVSQLN